MTFVMQWFSEKLMPYKSIKLFYFMDNIKYDKGSMRMRKQAK